MNNELGIGGRIDVAVICFSNPEILKKRKYFGSAERVTHNLELENPF